MKSWVVESLLSLALASMAFTVESAAEPYKLIRIGASVDYTWTAMEQVNKQLDKGGNVSHVGSGITGILDCHLVLTRFLMAGARVGYLSCFPGSANYNLAVYDKTTTVNASLVPLEAGLSLNLGAPATPVSIMAGIYLGYGFAFASFKNDIRALGQTATFTQPFSGGGLVAELPASVNFKMASALSFNINAGFRLARIPRMVQSADVHYTGIPGLSIPVGAKDDVLKDSDNSDLALNFSGFNVGVGLGLGF